MQVLTILQLKDLTLKRFEISSDPTYDSTQYVMKNLHTVKQGVLFKIIEYHVIRCKPPAGWQPIDSDAYQGGWLPDRAFRSHINDKGVFEMWLEYGSDRIGALEIEGEQGSDEIGRGNQEMGANLLASFSNLVNRDDTEIE